MLIEKIDRRKAERKVDQPQSVDSRLGYAIILASALSVVNFTLVFIARSQYGQDDVWWQSFSQALKSWPVTLGLVYLLHPFTSVQANVFGVSAAIAFGTRAVWIFNNEGYYASMSRVPQLGTLWIWLIIEMHYTLGAFTLLAVGLYTWAKGYYIM